MTHSDIVFGYDQQQCDPKIARRCPVDESHGRLGVHAGGQALICTAVVARPGPMKIELCGYGEPTASLDA